MNAFLNNPDLIIVSVGALVGVASSLVGAFLVLRKSSLLSDAISHSVLLGIILGYLITGDQFSPFLVVGAALAGVATVFLTGLLENSGRVKGDAAIGLVFPFMFAVGVLLINVYASNVHIDTDAVLLGEIGFVWLDTLTLFGLEVPQALLTLSVVTLLNALFVVVFYKELKLTTFDPTLAAALGFSPTLLYYLLLSLTSVTAVASFDAVGSVLFVAFVIVPVSAAYLLTDKLWRMILYGMLFSVASSVLGYVSALYFNVSIGGMMALATGVFLTLAFLLSPRYGLISQEARRRRQGAENAERLLLVHLYHHEAEPEEENRLEALRTHLRWSQEKAQRVYERTLDKGFVRKEPQNPVLELTEVGRARAREVLGPSAQEVRQVGVG